MSRDISSAEGTSPGGAHAVTLDTLPGVVARHMLDVEPQLTVNVH
jgi:hypothetical protein